MKFIKNTQPMLSHINVGTGVDCSIREMAETMALVVGYDGKIVFDITKPDGSPRKLMDVTRLENLGWKYRYNLKQGLELTYKWFINNLDSFRS
ncbi:GDP-L-fucose synthase [Escherichia coli]|nr:GDP-L-fucose synthase [Escherichia coli]